MKELTQEAQKKMLEILCAPEITDEPEESDFVESGELDEKAEELFVKNWIEREMN
jgi:hypothetical protein